MESDKPSYVYCYGSNHPSQIAKRLNLPLLEVLERCRACTLKGYRRAFMGVSKNWGSTSPATVVQDKESEVKAFAFLMTPEQITMMDKFEHVPTNYQRKTVRLVDKEGNTFDGQLYQKNWSEFFEFP
mmetsp:Transcript_12484/g.14296  ORF Transcript_12484/g.14296 Transcript_12484/m.14296 type:complete len:127 (+) Transcript_12484:26-406(+)